MILILIWHHPQWVTIVLHHHLLLHHLLLHHHLLLLWRHLLLHTSHLIHTSTHVVLHGKWVAVLHHVLLLHVLLLHHHHSLLLLHLIHLHHILLIRHAHLLLEHWINAWLEATRWLLLVSHWIHAHLNFSTVTLSCQQQIIFFFRRSSLSQSITADVKQAGKLVHGFLFLNWFLYFLTRSSHRLDHLSLIGLHTHSTEKIGLRILLWISLTHKTKWIWNWGLLLRCEVLLRLLWSCLVVHETESILGCGSLLLSWCCSTHAHASEHAVHILHLLLLLWLLLLVIHEPESILSWGLCLGLSRWTK